MGEPAPFIMQIQPDALSALFAASRDAVMGIKDGIVSFSNAAADTMLGIHPGDLAEHILPDYVISDPSEHFLTSFPDRAGQKMDATIVRQDGFTLLHISPQENNHSFSRLVPPSLDLGSMLMAEKMALDQLTDKTGAEEDPKLQDNAAVLYHSYYFVKRLHSHLSIACNIQQDQLPCSFQVEDLQELCLDLCYAIEHFTCDRYTFSFHAGPGSFAAKLDGNLIEIMLLNLFSNSMGHMPSGGVIKMELSIQGNRFLLSVQDNGTGIDPAKLSGNAPRDLTDIAVGDGLGLYIARGIAMRHGGALIIDATPGHGASVRISIPRLDCRDVKSSHLPYRCKSMDNIRTELSTVLSWKSYGNENLE